MRKNDLCMNSTFNRSYGVYFEYMNGEYPSPWFDYSCGWCGEWTRINNNFNINKHNQFHRNCGSNSAISKNVDWFGSHSYTTLCHDDIYIYNSLPITLINYTSRTNNNWIKWFIWWTCHVKRWRSSH